MHSLMMPGIAAVKRGDLKTGARLLGAVAQGLAARGADALVLACTEVPLVLEADALAVPAIHATFALAHFTIACAQRLLPGSDVARA